ncbi:hypothetical protein CTE05_16300 [Cellulomonas terrae]|uniref:Uncharacterized protein n=1 Tax=Cellulomonas terrae TaxID=311234 RepID=A0A511JKB2_9CELL|nr:hypothetical protein CTE05_16300 [Cellulomonas terrae]
MDDRGRGRSRVDKFTADRQGERPGRSATGAPEGGWPGKTGDSGRPHDGRVTDSGGSSVTRPYI